MKKFILTIFAALTMSAAMAQTESTTTASKQNQKRMDPTEMVTKRTQEMVEKYGLTTEQAAKLKTLNEKYMGKMGGPKGKGTGSSATNGQRPEKPMKADSLNHKRPEGGQHGGPDMTAYNTELKSILTEAQYKQYETDMANRKSQRQNKQ